MLILIKRLIFYILFSFIYFNTYCQNGIITGRIHNTVSNEALPFATVGIVGTTTGTVSDDNGIYIFSNLKPGIYSVSVSVLGFETQTIFDIKVTKSKPAEVDFDMISVINDLKEVEIKNSPFIKKEESPVSLRNISENEITRNPGGNRDISKVIQSLPGVASTVSYRNDIIIRGGSPNENRFYLDDIETPNINHFATQGASGGPVGMINVDYIREVLFYSSAFPADKSNALSSVLDFKLKDGRSDRIGGKLTIGASDLGITAEGPANKNANFIFSYRRSYLQFLFKALGLPFLPTYNDFLLKYKWKLGPKDEIYFIGLGAIDNSVLNTKLQETGDESQKYILAYLPEQFQWNYTNGIKYVHYRKNSYSTFILSRNFLNNEANKYADNIESSANKLLDYKSQEIENKFRIENTSILSSYKLTFGADFEYSKYNNNTFNKTIINDTVQTINYSSALDLYKWGLFGQITKSFFSKRFLISLGLRSDASNYDNSMSAPLSQLSPRLSLSYALSPLLSLNLNFGRYYQLPAYTVLGYINNDGTLINKLNNIDYMRVQHLVAGIDYISKNNLKLNFESFYKYYDHYPFAVRENISLANLGSDFGVVGAEEVTSSSVGRAYGFECFAQQKLFKGFYGSLSYTFVRSEFKNAFGKYISSSWDNRHIVNIIAGKSLNRDWEIGIKWKYSLGMPYTPYDFEATRTKANWDVNHQGIYNWEKLNSERMPAFQSLDIRIDKKYYRKNLTFNFYVDIQNLYNFKTKLPPYINVITDNTGKPITDPVDSNKYLAKYINSTSGTILPTIGIILEF